MSIQKRTVFFDDTGGFVRFSDWALVTTTLGTMAEPFLPNSRHMLDVDFSEFDPTDPIARVDEIRQISVDVQMHALSGGDHALNGGYQLPRGDRR
jgi:hypothetical protein